MAIVVTTFEVPRRAALAAGELSEVEPGWPFVDLCGRIEIEARTSEVRERMHRRLLQLRDERWAERAQPGQYPGSDARAAMLDKAIFACES